MINVKIDGDLLDGVTESKKRKAVIEPEIELELARFKEHWGQELGLGAMHGIEESALRTYLRWRLAKG